jgi:hypothetical protein
MNDQHAAVAESNRALEVFAAELTAATYCVALRHGAGDKWFDLEFRPMASIDRNGQETKGNCPRRFNETW